MDTIDICFREDRSFAENTRVVFKMLSEKEFSDRCKDFLGRLKENMQARCANNLMM